MAAMTAKRKAAIRKWQAAGAAKRKANSATVKGLLKKIANARTAKGQKKHYDRLQSVFAKADMAKAMKKKR